MTATLPHLNYRRTARARGAMGWDLVVDIFAGAGGASVGLEAALETESAGPDPGTDAGRYHGRAGRLDGDQDQDQDQEAYRGNEI